MKVVCGFFTFLLSAVLVFNQSVIAADDSGSASATVDAPEPGASYELGKGVLKSCSTADGKADQSLCGTNQECIVIPSTLYDESPVAVCSPYGTEYCKTNIILSQQLQYYISRFQILIQA